MAGHKADIPTSPRPTNSPKGRTLRTPQRTNRQRGKAPSAIEATLTARQRRGSPRKSSNEDGEYLKNILEYEDVCSGSDNEPVEQAKLSIEFLSLESNDFPASRPARRQDKKTGGREKLKQKAKSKDQELSFRDLVKDRSTTRKDQTSFSDLAVLMHAKNKQLGTLESFEEEDELSLESDAAFDGMDDFDDINWKGGKSKKARSKTLRTDDGHNDDDDDEENFFSTKKAFGASFSDTLNPFDGFTRAASGFGPEVIPECDEETTATESTCASSTESYIQPQQLNGRESRNLLPVGEEPEEEESFHLDSEEEELAFQKFVNNMRAAPSGGSRRSSCHGLTRNSRTSANVSPTSRSLQHPRRARRSSLGPVPEPGDKAMNNLMSLAGAAVRLSEEQQQKHRHRRRSTTTARRSSVNISPTSTYSSIRDGESRTGEQPNRKSSPNSSPKRRARRSSIGTSGSEPHHHQHTHLRSPPEKDPSFKIGEFSKREAGKPMDSLSRLNMSSDSIDAPYRRRGTKV